MVDSRSPAAPYLTVVVPVLDGADTLGTCLQDLRGSSFTDWELIVVDDGSTDGSREIAAAAGAKVLQTAGRQGPGAARNLGARQAHGEVLFFIDADCSAGPDTLARAVEILHREPQLEALFGSYDEAPSAPGLVARYKNLQHHFVHQQGSEQATTFWAGCGAIRRSVFEQLGGFDTERYGRPCIEDIELGHRLVEIGGQIRLAKDVQVKHHKAWTLGGVLRSDLVDRGIPWTLLLLEEGPSQKGLNLDFRGRCSVVLSLLVGLGLVLALVWPRTLLISLGAGLVLLWLNAGFYRLLARKGGVKLLMGGIVLHWLYQLNCAVAFLIGHVLFWSRHGRARS
jgi:glycosyltransferase involved in cell wall biosynthesis